MSLGALAFGVGASEVAHVLSTQTLWQSKPKNMRIAVEGTLGAGVHAKDVILAIIAEIGTAAAAAAAGNVREYAGSTIGGLGIEARLTIRTMSIEARARAGMVAPEDTTFAYLHGRPFAPKDADWNEAIAYWGSLTSDVDAQFDCEVALDAATIAPAPQLLGKAVSRRRWDRRELSPRRIICITPDQFPQRPPPVAE